MYMIPLLDPVKFKQVFQATNDTSNSNKFTGRSLGIQTFFTGTDTNNPMPPCMVDMYIVSLRENTGEQFQKDIVANWTDQGNYHDQYMAFASGPQQPAGKYFTRVAVEVGLTSNANSLTYLNKGVFKIHKHRSFMIGNQSNWAINPPVPEEPEQNYNTANITDLNKRFYDTLSLASLEIKAGTGPWKTLGHEQVQTTDQLYLMVHYSKPTTFETTLNMTANVVITGTTAN